MNDASDIADRKADRKAALALLALFTLTILLAVSTRATDVQTNAIEAPLACDPKSTPCTPPEPPKTPEEQLRDWAAPNPNFASDIAFLRKALTDKPQLNVHGTEYTLGQAAIPFIQLVYPNQTSENGATCFINIHTPNAGHARIVSDAPMVNLATQGLYYYDYTPTLIGVHMVSSYCTVSSQPKPTQTQTNTIPSGSIVSGSVNNVNDLDDSYLRVTALLSTGSVQANFSPSATLVNVTGLALYSRLMRNSGSANFTLCAWNYTVKKYGACQSIEVGPFPVMFSQTLLTNTTGGDFLNSTSTTGVVSILINSSSLSTSDMLVDWLHADILAGQNITPDIRGSGEMHVSANASLDVIGNANTTLALIKQSIGAANTSLHTALNNNFTTLQTNVSTLLSNQANLTTLLNAIGTNLTSVNTTTLRVLTAIIEANRTLHGALSLNYTALNQSFQYTNNLILNITTGTSNNTDVLNAIYAMNTTLHGAIYLNTTALQASLTNVNQTLITHIDNANTTILAAIASLNASLDGRLTSINASLSNQISAVNVSIILVINNTNETLYFVLSNLSTNVQNVYNNTQYLVNTTTTDLAIDQDTNARARGIQQDVEDILAILLDLRKRFIDYADAINRALFRPLFGQ